MLFCERFVKEVMRIYLLVLIYLCGKVIVTQAQEKDFVEVKKAGNITIYERWLIFPKSDPPVKAREVKTEFTYNNSIYAGLHLIQSELKIKQWQDHVSEFKVFKQKDTTTWFEYSYHDIPWPVSDQDHLLVYKLNHLAPDNLFIAFESIVDDKLAAVKKGVTRMHLSGSWQLQKIGPNKVKATYRILSTPLNIPKFLTDPIIRNNMMTTIEEYISILEKK